MPIARKPRLLLWMGLLAAWLAAPLAAPAGGESRLATWLAILALYSLLFWLGNGPGCSRWSPTRRILLILGLALSGLALVALGGVFGATYPVLVAALAGSTLRARDSWTLVGAQTAALLGVFAGTRFALGDATLLALVFGGLMLFVVQTAQVALAKTAALARLEQVHRELQVTQAALAESSRDAERLRIASDLHDVLGHHLTALSLTLEVASHGGAEAKSRAVDDALVLTKRLLRDLRQVVSALSLEVSDLQAALRRLAAETRAPRIHLQIAAGVPSPTSAAGHALLRSAQEAITNASRHGRAENLRLELDMRRGGVRLRAVDDGSGTAREIRPGHGLVGIRERAAGCGGTADWGFRPGGGFEVEIWVPGDGSAQ